MRQPHTPWTLPALFLGGVWGQARGAGTVRACPGTMVQTGPRAGELCVTREPLLPVLSPLLLCEGQAQTQVYPPCPEAELDSLKLKASRVSVQCQRCLSLSQAPEPETCEQDLGLRLPAAGTRDLPAPGPAGNIPVTRPMWPGHSHHMAQTFLQAADKWRRYASVVCKPWQGFGKPRPTSGLN